jgi:AraC-like DNA-binding protein
LVFYDNILSATEISSQKMKPFLEFLPKEREVSFVAKSIDYQYYPVPLHYHPEYELVLITESTGKRFICDTITDFKPGDLVLLGPLLPHLYRNDRKYYEVDSTLRAKATVVHFSEDTFAGIFQKIPEATALKNLLEKSLWGLNIIGKTNKIICSKLNELLELKGFVRWLKLLDILHILAESTEYTLISSNLITCKNEFESSRLNKVVEYVINKFAEDIYVSEVADLINMTENSFSKYFSRQTGKTFASFLAEIRVSHARKLLMDNNNTISEICFKCGFNNLSNFNRQFHKICSISPVLYRKQYAN